MTIQRVIEWVEAFHADSDNSLLVVLNLVSAGTWPLRRHFAGGYDPWADGERLQVSGSTRPVVFLDGLTPPLLRRNLIGRCKSVMATRPVTLVTTQMVEVGVDLDFAHALVDFQGIAATIQRGGRVGREGHGGMPRTVEVFALTLDDGATSFERLQAVRDQYDQRFKLAAFKREQEAEQKQSRLETRFFVREWSEGRELTDRDLTGRLLEILKKVMVTEPPDDPMAGLFGDLHGAGSDWGLDFLKSQFIAELYAETGGEEILLLASSTEFERLQALVGSHKRAPSPETTGELRRFVAERCICTFVREVLESERMLLVGRISELGGIRCMSRAGSNVL